MTTTPPAINFLTYNRAISLKHQIFAISKPYYDRIGNKIHLWSIPGPNLVSLVTRQDGSIRTITPIKIKNGLNPDDNPITLHNRLLTAPEAYHFDMILQDDGTLIIFPHLKAAGWKDAIPKSDNCSGITRILRGRTQEQACEWFYSNGFKVSDARSNISIQMQINSSHIGSFSPKDANTIRNLLQQGARIHHIETSLQANGDRFQGRGITFKHPQDRGQHTFNVDFTRENNNGLFEVERDGGYHVDIRSGGGCQKVKISTSETYQANHQARSKGLPLPYVLRTLILSSTLFGSTLFGATPATKQFQQTIQQNHLTDSYNSCHRENPIPHKGPSNGSIGGVGNEIGMILGLFDNPDELVEKVHHFLLETDGQVPFSNLGDCPIFS